MTAVLTRGARRSVRAAVTAIALGSTALLSLPQAASADESSVFGVQLGKPMSLPACESGANTNYHTLCHVEVTGRDALLFGDYQVIFPVDEKPGWAFKVYAVKVPGSDRLGRMYISISQPDSNERAAARALTDKYGAPTRRQTRVLQNALGARYESEILAWEKKSLFVVFLGAGAPGRTASIEITTKEMARALSDEQKAREEGKRPL